MPERKPPIQKLMLFYIADFLMKETDLIGEEPRGVYAWQIREYLKEKGIEAEEHAICRNIRVLRDNFKMDIEGGAGQPFYLISRYIDFKDLSLIAECIGAAKFLSKKDADELIGKLNQLCSKYREEELKKDYYVVERPRQTQQGMRDNLVRIREAIENNNKISFRYIKHTINEQSKMQVRKDGKLYRVSPYQVVLSEGNHYLIAYDDTYHQIRAYRAERMTGLEILYNEPRAGEAEYRKRRLTDYAKQTFGMLIGGDPKETTIQFDMFLLDAVLERFGSHGIRRVDDKHFILNTWIVISENFYGWICGLGEKAVIQGNEDVVAGFKKYLKKITAQYE